MTTSIFIGYIACSYLLSFLIGYIINGIFSIFNVVR